MAWNEYERLTAALLPAVLEAGKVELRYFHSGVEVQHKADQSPVTAADKEAEALLVAALGRIMPGVPVVAEELTAAGRQPEIGHTFFLVDPLDGTKEFIAGRDEFTINVALIEDRRPVFGIIYAPARGQLYLTRGAGEAVELRVRPDEALPPVPDQRYSPIRSRAPVATALVALRSRSHSSAGDAFLDKLGILKTRRLGSSMKFCLIARGEADVYGRMGPTCEWDTAAGQAILEAAGGCVTNLAGEPLTYGHSGRKFTNPEFVAWGRKSLI